MVDGVIVDLLHMVLLNSYSLKARVTSASILAHTMEQQEDKVQRAKKSLERLLPIPLLKLLCNKAMSGRVPNEFDKCTILRITMGSNMP